MTLQLFQTALAEKLNANDALRASGCEAVAEDALDVDAKVAEQLQVLNGVAMIVMTPKINVIGGGTENGIPVEIPELMISCAEIPALNRERPEAITALQAAERVALLFDSPQIKFKSITQMVDENLGLLTANVIFSTTMYLSLPTPQ